MTGTCGHCGLDRDVCRTCGQPIVWGTTARGKAMPLEATTVTVALYAGNVGVDGPMHLVRAHEPHWVRCPQSRAWTGKTRAELAVESP